MTGIEKQEGTLEAQRGEDSRALGPPTSSPGCCLVLLTCCVILGKPHPTPTPQLVSDSGM